MGTQASTIMTTEFDSFDESEVGGFVESPLGARNEINSLDAIVFIDESSPYTQEGLAGAALSQWEGLLHMLPTLSAHVAIVGPNADVADLWPSNVDWPSRISYEAVGRPPSEADIDRLFGMIQQSQLSTGTPFFFFKVDNSGSMFTSSIEPSLSTLRERLSAIERRSEIDEFVGEDWLDVLHNNLRQDLVGAARIIRLIGYSPYVEPYFGEDWARLDLDSWNALWNDDVTQQTIANFNLNIRIRLMHVPQSDRYPNTNIWPTSVPFPQHVEVVSVGSSLNQRELNAMYTSLFSQIAPTKKIRLYVNGGPDGILGESEIGLLQDQLFERLSANYAQLEYRWAWSPRRWLSRMTDGLRRFIDIWSLP